MDRQDEIAATRASWDAATRAHNAHKGDQAAFLRAGGDTLFPEELELLGPLSGRTLVHVQCNAGQDSLCLARRGAAVHGVDLSPVAVDFARRLSAESGIPATFEEAEALAWMHGTERRFELAFASYGVTSWHPDVSAWMGGVARVLQPGGRFVYVEFHSVPWALGPTGQLDGADYFTQERWAEPVPDYVAESGPGLLAPAGAQPAPNTIPSFGYQHTLGAVVSAVVQAGLVLEELREYPYANGYRAHPLLELTAERRWVWPAGRPRLPLMYGVAARRPD